MTQVFTLRRWLMRLALCSAIGVVATVAVAWGLACATPSNTEGTLFSRASGSGLCWSYWLDPQPGSMRIYRVPTESKYPGQLVSDVERAMEIDVPSWSVVHTPPASDVPFHHATEDARGWPLLALVSTTTARPQNNTLEFQTHAGIALGVDKRTREPRIVLPLRPIWSGLAIDAIFFGGLAFALLFGPSIAGRTASRMRGACVHCGYDLRATPMSAVCPECGT